MLNNLFLLAGALPHIIRKDFNKVLPKMPTNIPVIISGGGPCGLLCAVVLKKYDVPFILVERVSEEKQTADVGSGFDMAPTATRIFEHLELPNWQERLTTFKGITMMRMGSGSVVRKLMAADLPDGEASAVKRSSLQQCLKDKLGESLVSGRTVHYGASIVNHEESVNGSDSKVSVTLSTGVTLEGRCLLVCEGWKSVTRQRLLGEDKDPINFCHVAMWWGKSEISLELDNLLKTTQAEGRNFCWFLGDGGNPGNFVFAPESDGKSILWSAAQSCDTDPAQSDDLTIRGGVRGQASKDELTKICKDRCEVIRTIVADTPASAVTKVGLYDRANLDHDFTSQQGLVALLGDSAHPQTPFLGQGCNMALSDAFAVCTRLGANNKDPQKFSVQAALACMDSPTRKKFSKYVVQEARKISLLSTSPSYYGGIIMRMFMKVAPTKMIFPRVDNENRNFVNVALTECGHQPLRP